MSKKIIVSVISDLVTDQRVQKECNTLLRQGYEILLVGRKTERNFSLKELPYKTIRFYNPFSKGPMMYLFFNCQLFFFLLFKKVDILWSNDLDTLLPNYLISNLKRCLLIYDSHEYFIESVYKKSSKKIWEKLENFLFPKLKNVITVNDSIKIIYENKYKIPITVVRNVPLKFSNEEKEETRLSRSDKTNLVIQGMGINENRGAEEAVSMMRFLPDNFDLYFIGSGTILPKLKETVRNLNLTSRVIFINPLPYHQMMAYTRQCFLGLIFEKIDVSGEHLFSLPNKLFDYIQAGVPVLSSPAPEIKKIIEKFNVGDFISNFNPEEIAQKIMLISKDQITYQTWKRNTIAASAELNWQNEEKILIDFMKHLK